ncbi:flavin-containing monooxygenase 5-like [Ctenodactylus gundi]
MKVQKVAVIGAGVSGLAAIRSCLEEGLEPLCFEKSNDIGGLWRYEETPECGRPGIYRSLTSNTSKEMMAFSDYPFPDHFPNYLHNTKVMQYLRMYAKHFGLVEHIQFQSKVCRVRKRPDFLSSGQWDVVVEANGKQNTYVFDGVMICSGYYTEKHLPLQDFAGLQKFRGRVLHSWEYKHPANFAGKRVVVVGLGNSGVDIAGEISRVAQQVFLSTRRGAWIWNRIWDNGNPMDATLFTRYNRIVQKLSPTFLTKRWAENKLNARFNHANYGIQPQHSPPSTRTISPLLWQTTLYAHGTDHLAGLPSYPTCTIHTRGDPRTHHPELQRSCTLLRSHFCVQALPSFLASYHAPPRLPCRIFVPVPSPAQPLSLSGVFRTVFLPLAFKTLGQSLYRTSAFSPFYPEPFPEQPRQRTVS